MTNKTKAGLIAVAVIFMAAPALSHAATFAYVDRIGDVRSVVSGTAMGAISTAPNIHQHSGVMLLNTAADFGIIDDHVFGI